MMAPSPSTFGYAPPWNVTIEIFGLRRRVRDHVLIPVSVSVTCVSVRTISYPTVVRIRRDPQTPFHDGDPMETRLSDDAGWFPRGRWPARGRDYQREGERTLRTPRIAPSSRHGVPPRTAPHRRRPATAPHSTSEPATPRAGHQECPESRPPWMASARQMDSRDSSSILPQCREGPLPQEQTATTAPRAGHQRFPESRPPSSRGLRHYTRLSTV